ncbi:YdbH family protein [Providencia heimbachae]|uniref:YdbH family protein n=1 Tax=Providencia heimbachae TaxID=333962 RepID=UPI001586D080|nr:YdbH family protein [Providencia heimbachae]
MNRACKILLLVCSISFAFFILLWVTFTRWVPIVAAHFLPPSVTLSLSQPKFNNHQLQINQITLNAGTCHLLEINDIRASWLPLHIKVNSLNSSAVCLNEIEATDNPSEPINIAELVNNIPYFSLVIDNVDTQPWSDYNGSLWLRSNTASPLQLDYRGENLEVSSRITADEQLVINDFSVFLPEFKQRVELTGGLKLPLTADKLPENGAVEAKFKLLAPNKSLLAKLEWQNNQGTLNLTDLDEQKDILNLPWHLSDTNLKITQGQWQWQEANIPVQGGIALQIDHWNKTLSEMVFTGRLNIITQASKGKANLVLTLPPSQINFLDANINLRLNGQIKYNDLAVDINLPAKITGQLALPSISFLSGSLLRAYGRVSPTILLQEIRLPLAGTSLSHEGISGRLQAILKIKEQYWGDFAIHLDGSANKFTIDNGKWFWNYWGNARLPALSARWDIKGQGNWQDTLITLNSLTTGFDQIKYGLLSMSSPRLILTKPLQWQRDEKKANFYGSLEMTSNRMLFGTNSYLPKITAKADIKGKSPADFQLKGDLSTKNVGPIVIFGRWDGERLRGEARWPEQSVTAFQTLIPVDLGIELRQGKLFSQAAFSMTPEEGFTAGGHWRVANTSLWLKDGEINGLDFVLPWRLKNSTWTLGEKSSVELRIKQLTNLFELTDITADLTGTYPPSDAKPLSLSNVGFKMLGGEVHLDLLRWPQNKASTIKLHQIELSQLFTLLKVSQFAVSGRVNGELPFYLNNPEWIVKKGWMENSGPLTLRLDTQFVESIQKDNISAGSAIGWLQYLEIERSRTDVNITNLGLLSMKTILEGYNSQEKKKREVHLNYQHEENIFQLWRSLRFGSSLEEWLEKNL